MVEIGGQNCETRASPSEWVVDCIDCIKKAILTWLFLEIQGLISIRRLA